MRSIALIPLSAGFALLAAEGLYRLTRLDALSPTSHPAYVEHDPELGWRYVPGTVTRHRTDEFDVVIRINQAGFRGPERALKQPGVTRILVLGDSEAFGWGVDEHRTFWSLVDEARPEWEILNAAVAGYGTDQQLLALQRLLPAVQPDLVLCLFTGNDLFENTMRVTYGRRKPWFTLQDGEAVLHGQPVPYPVLDRASLLARALKKNLWAARFPRIDRDPHREWAMTMSLYRAMRDELNGRPLLLVSDADRLDHFARNESGIFHIDIGPSLNDTKAAVRFPEDGHLNEAGHRMVAAAVERGVAAVLSAARER